MIDWLENLGGFPPPDTALVDPNGLLCASTSLSAQMVIAAYSNGIFPWYSEGEPVLWWTPNPRMVLFPSEIKISRSMRRILRARDYEVRLDYAFGEVIDACAQTPRAGQDGTWITEAIKNVYGQLFDMGIAHSVETWIDGELAGGLYGLAIGKMFYGESMFSRKTNASKIATIHLACFLRKQGFGLIDCQMNTPHLASMGAREIPREEFIDMLHELVLKTPTYERWPTEAANQVNELWQKQS